MRPRLLWFFDFKEKQILPRPFIMIQFYGKTHTAILSKCSLPSLAYMYKNKSRSRSLSYVNQANTSYSTNIVSMLAHRLQRWPNIEATLVDYLVFDGKGPCVRQLWNKCPNYQRVALITTAARCEAHYSLTMMYAVITPRETPRWSGWPILVSHGGRGP